MPSLTDVLGGVAGVVSPILGSIISQSSNNASVDAANQANRDFQVAQQDKQNAYNKQMWDLQNDYNNPTNTRDRLVKAGYNPALMYGSPTGNVAGPPAQSARAEMVVQPHPATDYGSAAASSIRAFNDLRLGSAQVNNMQANTTNAISTAIKTSVDTVLEQLGFPNQQAKLSAETNNLNVDAGVKQFLAPRQASVMDAQVNKDNADVFVNLSQNERNAAMQAVTIKEALQRIATMRIQNAVLQNKSSAEIDQMRANVQTLLNSKQLGDMDINMRQHNVMPHDPVWFRSLSSFITGLFGRSTVPDAKLSGAQPTIH